MTNIEEIRKAALNADEQIKIILALTEAGVPGPVISEWIRPEPKPREDWMVRDINPTKEIFVAPDGNDNNTGNLNNPLKTVNAAFDALKASGNNTALRFKRGGTYDGIERVYVGSRGYAASLDNPILVGAYGDGDRPILNMSKGWTFEGGEINPVEGWYFKDLDVTGAGFTVWDDCRYMLWQNVLCRDQSLPYNISMGRLDDGFLNHHFAILDCEQKNNSNTGISSGASDIFIDNNDASRNGNGNGGRNYYLGGNLGLTKNIVLQNSRSTFNCPNPVTGGGGNSPHYTTHGWADGVFLVNNHFEEIETTSGGGCWGLCVDEGRSPDWGSEKFTNVTMTGNTIKYCGNQNLSISNADDPLVGWNDIYIDSKNKGWGICAPGKPVAAPDFVQTNGRFVFNKIHVPAGGTGININLPDAQLEYNEIIKLDPSARGIVVNGTELLGDALGTNIYKAA